MRDAAGQLADRFEPLGLAERVFRQFAAFRFVVQALGAAQRHPQRKEQQQRCRQTEHQMAGDHRQPFGTDRRGLDAGERINRIAWQLAKADAGDDAVNLAT